MTHEIELTGQTLALHENGPLGRPVDLDTAAEILGLDIEQTTQEENPRTYALIREATKAHRAQKD